MTALIRVIRPLGRLSSEIGEREPTASGTAIFGTSEGTVIGGSSQGNSVVPSVSPSHGQGFYIFFVGAETRPALDNPLWPTNDPSYGGWSSTSSDPVGFYSDIFAKQYGRLRTFFDRELKSLQWSDDEANEEIIERLSEIIDLVGEVAIYAAYKEAQSLGDRHFTLERLLTAIASAKDKLTEQSRTKLLLQYALSPDSSARYAAVRALGRMQGGDARARLREISAQEKNPQIARAAEALSK